MIYFETILESGVISLADLNQKVETALLDPRRRAVAHDTYSEMWKAVEESVDGAFFEDLLKNLPPSDKPN